MSETLIFKTLEQQRDLIAKAQTKTRIARRRKDKPLGVTPAAGRTPATKTQEAQPIDYNQPVIPFDAEVW